METIFVIQQVIVLAILMGVGYMATKKNIINEEVVKGMSGILTNIALPALILSSFQFTYSKDTIKGVVTVFIYSLIIHILMILLSKIFFRKYKKEENAVLSFGTVFPNSGFMGLPLILELFGQEGMLYASIFMIPYHTLLWTYGEGLFTDKKKESPLKKLLSTPSLIAIILGTVIFVFKINIPYIVSKPLSMFSALTSPLSMFILGQKITKLNLKEIIGDRDIYYGCFIKLIIVPILTFIFLKMISSPSILTGIIVTMQALPTAILLVVLSQQHNVGTDFASKFTIVSHIISIITIPLIIIGTGILR
jgi:predicted permease